MERRLFSFIIASTAFFLIYASLRIMLVPPPEPAPLDVAEQVADVDGGVDSITEKAESVGDAVDNSDVEEGDELESEEEETPIRGSLPVWSTLGSMDPSTGHVVLVTLNSRGAGIERVELTERKPNGRLKYRRVDVRSGYLGYLALDRQSTEMGALVNVVGPGTPAAVAKSSDSSVAPGLQPGDLITELNGVAITNAASMQDYLATTKPNEDIELVVQRETGGESTQLAFTTTLSEHPLDLLRLSDVGGVDEVLGNQSRLSALITVGRIGRKEILPGQRSLLGESDPTELVWEIVDQADDDSLDSIAYRVSLTNAEMKAAGGKRVALARSYRVTPGSFVIDMDVQLDNQSDESQELAYRLEGVNGVTLEGWWYSNKISPNWGGSAARDIVYRTPAEGHALVSGYGLLKSARKESVPDDQTLFAPDSAPAAKQLQYIGVDAQYFTVAYLPSESETLDGSFRRASATIVADPELVPNNQERAVNTSFYLDSSVVEVPPGSAIRQSLRMFAGPKRPDLLASYGLDECIYYGWFSIPARWLGHLLHGLSGVGNYAIAIVLLTLIVRGCMFPLSRKAAVNAQRMQELAPELKKITEKYKDDMEGRLRAQRELQKRVGFNPMAGCLPMFLQLPIFIGLYRTLSVDIELRQEAFMSSIPWASNLAAPDMTSYWGDWLWDYLSGRGTGWLGPYFNLLPLLVVVLFLAQQKMFMPPATDEQTAMTQKMMNYMTLVMGLFFFRVPAGLCIYFITSSLWGIGERIIVKRTLPKTPHFDKSVLDGVVVADNTAGKQAASPVNGQPSAGGNTWGDKLRERLNPEPPTKSLPRDRKRPAGGKKRS
ncbi:MAG: YidC/Oxa1 family insertase periplasmic-domain containing protein [Planctomycetota bacterium]